MGGGRGQISHEFEVSRLLCTFRGAEEVVAHARPTGESNPAANGRTGGGIPIAGPFEQSAEIWRRQLSKQSRGWAEA